jgi:hypothetical protein
MAELCLGSKPLHRLCSLLVNLPSTKEIMNRDPYLSVQEHPAMFGRLVKGGLDQFLADPFVLICLDRARLGISPHGR